MRVILPLKAEPVPARALADLADAAQACFRELEAFVLEPSLGRRARVETSRRRVDELALLFERKLEPLAQAGGPGRRLRRLTAISEALRDSADLGARAAQELDLYGVETDCFLREACRALSESSAALAQALRLLRSDPPRAAGTLALADQAGSRADSVCRKALRHWAKSGSVPEILKTREILRRFLSASDGLHRAAELLAELAAAGPQPAEA